MKCFVCWQVGVELFGLVLDVFWQGEGYILTRHRLREETDFPTPVEVIYSGGRTVGVDQKEYQLRSSMDQ